MTYERLDLKTGDELNEAVFKRIDDAFEDLASEVNERQKTVFGYYSIEFEQGSIGSSGTESTRSDRIKSANYYSIANFTNARITSSNFAFWLAFYDDEKVFSSIKTPTKGYTTITRDEIVSLSGLESGYVRFIVFQVNDSTLTPEDKTGFGIYGSIFDNIEGTLKTAENNNTLLKNLMYGESSDFTFEQGSVSGTGAETDSTKRIRTDFLGSSTVIGARVNTGYKIWYYTFSEAKTFVRADTGSGYDGYQSITFSFTTAERYVRIVVAPTSSNATITPDANTGFTMTVNTFNEKIDAAIKEATQSIGGSRKGTLGLPEYFLDVDSAMSDATWVGDKYVGIGSTASDDLDTTTAGQMRVYSYDNGIDQPRTSRTIFYHKWGHCNTVDYSPMNDALIMGNGSGSYNLEGKIFIIPNFSELIVDNSTIGNSSNPFTLENTNAIVIDCTGYDLGTKFNVMWGEVNGKKHNIAYLVTAKMGSSTSAIDGGDNGTIRRLLLGLGSTALEYGTINESAADGEFNGTFQILDTYTQGGTSYDQCNQGSCFYRGSIFSAVGHDGIWLWKMNLGNEKISYDEWKQYTYNDDGSVASTNASSCCIKDGYLYFGATYVGVMAFRLP